MHRILILADGQSGKKFLKRLVKINNKENIFDVVYINSDVLPDERYDNFFFYQFDPTSLIKISDLLKTNYDIIIIILKNRRDIEGSISNIRYIQKKTRIVVLGHGRLENDDDYLVELDSYEILANHVIDYIPNIPVFAQNVGLKIGEIMEVLVPFGSTYAYRHIESIEQSSWRIAAIYRRQKLILPSPKQMILPNDELLIIGQPTVLKMIFRAVKQQLGQFPAPYGEHIYLFINMDIEKEHEVARVMKKANYLREKLHKKLYIRIINPQNIRLLEHIKSYDSKEVTIDIDYENRPYFDTIKADIKRSRIGLFISTVRFFSAYENRIFLYHLSLPVFKVSMAPIRTIDTLLTILSPRKEIEQVSTTMFDIASQLHLNLELIEYMHQENDEIKRIIEHFQNLSTIFSKNVQIINCQNNPIRSLKDRENLLYCIPFTENITKERWQTLFSTKSEEHYTFLEKFHQIFIPIQI